ncbi:MAG: phosphohydrolase, partial [Treponema sp.]|nr:phosphohydrolase [Treponema sp.]
SSRLEKFIQTLFDSKAEHKQLDNCGLTFRDLAKVKESFVQLLTGYYHSRIEYPNQKDPDKEDVKQVEDRQEKKSSQDKVQDKLEKNQDKKLESKKEEKKQVGSK